MAESMTPEAQEELATQIVVGGETFQLKGLSAARGTQLYAKLPDDYKNLAKHYSSFAKSYRAAINIPLPAGTTFEQAWAEYLSAARDGAGKLSQNAAPYLKQMASLFDPLLPKPTLTGKVLGKGFSTVGELLTGAVDGADATIGATFKLASATGSAVHDSFFRFASEISDAQADAFGAAMAGSVYYEARTRQGKSASQLSLSSPGSAITAGFQYLTKDVPLVSDAWVEIKALAMYLWEVITHIGKEEKPRSLAEFQNMARAEHAADKGQSFHQRLQDQLAAIEFPKAAQRIVLAENIAGIAIKDRVDALQGKQGYVDTKGNVKTADNKGDANPVTKDGAPLTAGQVVKSRFAEATEEFKQKWDEHGLAGKAAMAAGGSLAVAGGAVATVASAKGIAKGAVEGYREAPLQRAQAHGARMESLQSKAEEPKKWHESTARQDKRVAHANSYAAKSEAAMHREMAVYEQRGGNSEDLGKTKPGFFQRSKQALLHPIETITKIPEKIGQLLGRGADELAVTGKAMKEVVVGGERMAGAAKLLPRGSMITNIAVSAIEDGGSLVHNTANGELKGATVDGSKIAGTVVGSTYGTMAGVALGGTIGQGVGTAVGFFFGGAGAIPGAVAGRAIGTGVGAFLGGWGGGVAGHGAGDSVASGLLDYEAKPEVKPEVKPFTNEELVAMMQGQSQALKQVQQSCSAQSPDTAIKFDSGKRVGFATCRDIAVGAIQR